MKKRFNAAKILAAAATLVLLTSGCMQVEVGVVVKDDGSADLKLRAVASLDAIKSMSSGFGAVPDVNDSSNYLRRTIEGSSTSMSYSDTPCDDPSGAPETSSPEAVTTCIPPGGAIPTTVPLSVAEMCAQMRKENDIATAVPAGIVFTEILDDKWCGWEITGTAKNTQEIITTLRAMASVMDEDEDDTPFTADEFVIAKDAAGGWSLLIKDPFGCRLDEESSDTAGMEAFFGAFLADYKLTYNFQLPGVPSANNATSVSGNTFTWSYSFAEMTAFCAQPDRDFRALTTPGTVAAPVEGETKDAGLTAAPAGDSDDGGSTLKILLSVVALAAAGAGGFVLKRRRDYGYTDSAAQTSVAPVKVAPVWDAAANAWAATGPDGVSYLYDQQTSQWVPRR